MTDQEIPEEARVFTASVIGSEAVNIQQLPKPKRHMRKVRLSCLECGYVYETSVQVAEPKSILRYNFSDVYACPRCVAKNLAQNT